ncbi:MAG: cellulase family glycosylhydrolase [Fibromonadaceae bacterium]|jgi:endoglucanase|nr:cellulase family glycosylhydrolase [Fibromonadaceae bacterium]
MLSRFVSFLLVFTAFCSAANFTTTHGKLRVNGGKILDRNNQEIVLRGMSLYWYQGPFCNGQPSGGCGQPGNQFYTQNAVRDLANNWGANVIRAAIGNVQQEPANALAMAGNMMRWAHENGIYVIIDNHSHIAHRPAHATAAVNFFRAVSDTVRQRGYTHVIYELYNEPVCDSNDALASDCGSRPATTWAQIKSFSQPVITAIRNNDPDGLIVVGTPSFSSSIAAARNDPLTGAFAHNVLYALHFYAGTAGHGAYRLALEAAYCNNFPVFVTEWGTSAASGAGAISTSNSNTWISLLEAAKVSHVNWSLSSTRESSAALTGASITASGGTTPSGDYVRNLFRLNTGATLAQVGLSSVTINCSSTGPSGPDGRIGFGSNGSLANFASKNGADSALTSSNIAVLANTSANFTANYTLVGIERPGSYLISFNVASNAGGTVSWSGSGIPLGQAQITSTGSLETFQYTEPQVIVINEFPETPLQLSFQMPSSNSLRARWVYVSEADSADSVKYNISSIKKGLISSKNWSYDAFSKTFVFETKEGTLSIYNLRGERKAIYAASGRVSLKEMPSGTYLAIYRRNNQISQKIIHLK